MMAIPRRADPLPWVLVVLTMTTGLVDAVSVLGLGRVFTANMTGNVVFLGFATAGVSRRRWLLTFAYAAHPASKVVSSDAPH